MNKRLEEYAKSKDLVTVKESGLVYGKIREMFVVIQEDLLSSTKHTIQVAIKKGEKEPQPSIEAFAAECKARYSFLIEAVYEKKKLTAQFQVPLSRSKKDYVACMAEYIDEQNYLVRRTKTKAKTKLVSGCVGAMLGAALGAILLANGVYIFFRYDAILGGMGNAIIMVILAFLGFKIFGKRQSLAGLIMTGLILVIASIGGIYYGVALNARATVKTLWYREFWDALAYVPQYLAETGKIMEMIILLIGSWAVIGGWIVLVEKRVIRENSRKMQTRKLAPVEQQKQGM